MATTSTEGSDSSGSMVSKVLGAPKYFRESIEELKKVSHPTRQETMQTTTVAVIIIVFVATVLFLFDFLANKLMAAIIGA